MAFGGVHGEGGDVFLIAIGDCQCIIHILIFAGKEGKETLQISSLCASWIFVRLLWWKEGREGEREVEIYIYMGSGGVFLCWLYSGLETESREVLYMFFFHFSHWRSENGKGG